MLHKIYWIHESIMYYYCLEIDYKAAWSQHVQVRTREKNTFLYKKYFKKRKKEKKSTVPSK